MPILSAPTTAPKSYTASEIINDALIEIGILAPGDEDNLSGDVAQWAFRQLNDLIDVWSAQRAFVYSLQEPIYPFTPGLSPHTIGPNAATWYQRQRPVRIVSANLLLNGTGGGTNIVDLPINVTRDAAWWAAQQTKGVETDVPTDLYYNADWENGQCYFWPVPNVANSVRLQLWTLITQLGSITDEIGGEGGPGTLPPAYRAGLKYTLAEMLCPGAKVELDPTLEAKARKARIAIFGNNAKSPKIATADYGMPNTGQKRRAEFNWESGQPM